MKKHVIWALALIAIVVVVLLLTKGTVKVNFGFWEPQWQTALALLGFTGVGVAIGLLLK